MAGHNAIKATLIKNFNKNKEHDSTTFVKGSTLIW